MEVQFSTAFSSEALPFMSSPGFLHLSFIIGIEVAGVHVSSVSPCEYHGCIFKNNNYIGCEFSCA